MSDSSHPNPLNESSPRSAPAGRLVRVVLSLLVLAAVALIASRYVKNLDEVGATLRQADFGCMAAMVALLVAAYALNAEILRQSLLVLGHQIARSEAIMIAFLRTYAGLILPKAGYGAAGVYLKVKHGVDFAKSGSLVLPVIMLQCCVLGPLGLLCQWLLATTYDYPFSWVVAGTFAATTLVGLSFFVLRWSVPIAWTGRVASFFRRLGDAWRILSRSHSLVMRLLVLHLMSILLRAIRLQMAFYAVGAPVDFLGFLGASLLADVAFIVSPTPNGLGTREAAIVTYCFTIMAVPQELALSAVLLDRVLVTLVVVVVAQFATYRLAKPGSNKSLQETA